jgi:hypothetical protein
MDLNYAKYIDMKFMELNYLILNYFTKYLKILWGSKG